MSEKKKKESRKSHVEKKPSKSKEPEKGKKDLSKQKTIQITEPPSEKEKLCIHHGKPFSLYCESCDEPICQQCSLVGPHNNQLHRINNLQDAYDPRKRKLALQINTYLLEKKNKLLAQTQRIEYRLEEIHYIKELIEKDAKIEYAGIFQRLDSAEGAKIALLQHDMHQIQQDLNKINDIASTYEKVSENNMTFLLQARKLEDDISYLINKPFKLTVDVYPYDLPRELTQRRERVQQLEQNEKSNEMLEQVIWELLKSEKEKEKEIEEWSKLNEKYKDEIIKSRLVCYYCGQALDGITVNDQCPRNSNEIEENCFYYKLYQMPFSLRIYRNCP